MGMGGGGNGLWVISGERRRIAPGIAVTGVIAPPVGEVAQVEVG